MLMDMDGSDWMIFGVIIALVAFWMGWFADSILGGVGFGLTGNTILFALGGVAGLFALDYLMMERWISTRFEGPYIWFGAALCAGTGLVLMLACLKVIGRR